MEKIVYSILVNEVVVLAYFPSLKVGMSSKIVVDAVDLPLDSPYVEANLVLNQPMQLVKGLCDERFVIVEDGFEVSLKSLLVRKLRCLWQALHEVASR